MRLQEFKLHTYHERFILAWALDVLSGERDLGQADRQALDALKERVAETQCRLGGCEICCDPAK